MESIYPILVLIHIISAIVGIGPGFVLTKIIKSAKTMDEIRYAFRLKKRIHVFVMTGGILLLVTGLLMGFIHPILFKQGWYLTSLTLYFIAIGLGPTLLKKYAAPINEMLKTHKGDDVPESYANHVQKLLRTEYVENTLLLFIIIMMILKPF
ncbi:DUF2269 family protein [Gracilibacillus dipsosauri]|uniref:DUF2269 family protein n=1 Tax=Gracilibacillus dipsosauri TaxID=178340 RepID=UPI00240941DF